MPSHNLLCQGTSGVEANGINALFQEKDDCCNHVEMKLLYPANLHGFELIQTRGGVHFYHFCPAIVGKAHVMIESIKLFLGYLLIRNLQMELVDLSNPRLKIQKRVGYGRVDKQRFHRIMAG